MINSTTLLGRLTADPELRYTPAGVAVCTFALAVDRKFTNAQGERETDFFDIVVWRQLAESCANYLKKGQQAALEGYLQTRYYERDGRRVKVVEVVADNVQFLSAPGQAKSNSGGQEQGQGQRNRTTTGSRESRDPFVGEGKEITLADDDRPF
ncbi:single-stranded DNA-binding protein [Paenibacillus aestuarii]|uniref:Single-stranded DNA-binding protein n=1 Tax=Paenibacillus aestuarii TaxID=516965 RepID=A0ABW0K6Z5_9BACL